jgi:uncharacterized Zn finger protein
MGGLMDKQECPNCRCKVEVMYEIIAAEGSLITQMRSCYDCSQIHLEKLKNMSQYAAN